jgi:AmiR/NasT family two-component response regulator
MKEEEEELRRLVEQLTVAVEHRTTIGMALGMLRERLDLSADEAFAYLRRASSHQNRKLYDIAREFVATGKLPQPERIQRRRPSAGD